MSETFCQICHHPSPGHEPGCPVETGQPQSGPTGNIGVSCPGATGERPPVDPKSFHFQPAPQPTMVTGQPMSPLNLQAQAQPGDPPFKGELTIIWATEKAEIMRRLDKLETDLADCITVLCLGIDAVQLDTATQEDWDGLNALATRAKLLLAGHQQDRSANPK